MVFYLIQKEHVASQRVLCKVSSQQKKLNAGLEIVHKCFTCNDRALNFKDLLRHDCSQNLKQKHQRATKNGQKLSVYNTVGVLHSCPTLALDTWSRDQLHRNHTLYHIQSSERALFNLVCNVLIRSRELEMSNKSQIFHFRSCEQKSPFKMGFLGEGEQEQQAMRSEEQMRAMRAGALLIDCPSPTWAGPIGQRLTNPGISAAYQLKPEYDHLGRQAYEHVGCIQVDRIQVNQGKKQVKILEIHSEDPQLRQGQQHFQSYDRFLQVLKTEKCFFFSFYF